MRREGWDNSPVNITAGQSGQPFSSHRVDQWKTCWIGESLPMQYRRVEVKSSLELTPAN